MYKEASFQGRVKKEIPEKTITVFVRKSNSI
jgi:hypothetical protein